MILFVATTNAGKLRELADLLGPEAKLQPPPPGYSPPPETGAGYTENARLKAQALCTATGCPAIADDSGLEVDALGGRPGIESARYGANDDERIVRLLSELRNVPRGRRAARFRCCLTLALPDGREVSAEGRCEGEIADAPRGGSGFGYDPIFLVPSLGRTFGELSIAEKSRISHRAQAARRLAEFLPSLWPPTSATEG